MSRRTRATEREHGRTRRRDVLAVLLARAERLLPAEADVLRSLVEAEIVDADRARRAAGGQTAALRRTQARVEAAEQAMVEIEADRDRAQQTLVEQRDQHRLVEAAYVEHLATAAVLADMLAAALAKALDGDRYHLAHAIHRLCMGTITPAQALAETDYQPRREHHR